MDSQLLYNFDICSDRLTTLQSLLLMTLCPSDRTSPEIIKDASHWLGLAISLAYVLGLNRDIQLPNQSLRGKHLERRIWWITFIRDRTLSLRSSFGSRRRIQIAKKDSYISMLSLEDFELEENAAKYEGIDELRMKVIAVDCVEKAMMCWCSSEDLISKCSNNSSERPSLPLKVIQVPNLINLRSAALQEQEKTRKDKEPCLEATKVQVPHRCEKQSAEVLLGIELDNDGLFYTADGIEIINDYDDYFAYLQEPAEDTYTESIDTSSSLHSAGKSQNPSTFIPPDFDHSGGIGT